MSAANSKRLISATEALIVGLLSSFTTIASDYAWWEKPYVGADAQIRRMDFKGGYGDNLLQHISWQGNVYIGLKFNNSVGLEAGYESTVTRTRSATLRTGDIAAGTPIMTSCSPAVFRSKAKIKGPHVELVGFYSPNEQYPLQFLGTVGASFIKGTFERQTLELSNEYQCMVRTLSAHKVVLRLSGGLKYMFNEHFGARATIGWINTGKMVIFADDTIMPSPEMKPKNSTVYGLGVLWAF